MLIREFVFFEMCNITYYVNTEIIKFVQLII
jgi:hypothetical protein